MWQALAAYAVRGPTQAALLAFSTLLLSLVLPPLVVISNAIVALVWLRLGPVSGLVSITVALVLGTIIASFSGMMAVPAVLMIFYWLPVVLMAAVLRETVSLSLAILFGVVLALVGVLVAYLVLADPSESWQSALQAVSEITKKSGGTVEDEKVAAWSAHAGRWMTGFCAATLFVIAVVSLLLARVWQARMFNPGGLQKEFHGLRYGLVAGAVGSSIVLAAAFLNSELLTNLAIVVVVAFALQGLAVLHALAAQLKMHPLAMVAVYGFLLVLAPTSIKVIGLLGLADTWLDFRSRLSVIKKD